MKIKIREAAAKKGMNIKDVCEKCGYKSLPSFYRQINNPETISMRTLIKIANVIGCEVNDFFCPDETVCPHCGKPIKIEVTKK